MKATIKDVNYYIDLVNEQLQSQQIELYRANGTNYIHDTQHRTVFQGTMTEVYFFLVGVEKIL